MNYTIRTATADDITAVMYIEKNGFIPQIREEKSVFLERIGVCPHNFLVFEDYEKKVFGYICGEFMNKMPESREDLALGHSPSEQNPESPYFYISSFSILPEYRGNGTGSALWNESLKFFEKGFNSPKTLILLVNEAWAGAKHIYEKSGFKEVKIINAFFPTEKEGVYTNGILMKN